VPIIRPLLILLLLLPLTARAGEVVLPDTPRGRVARAFLDAYHAGPEAVRAFTLEHRTAAALARTDLDERVARYQTLHATLGDLELLQVSDLADGIRLVAFASTMETWVRIDLTFDGDKLEQMALQPTGPPRDEPYVTEWETLGDLLEQAVASSGVPGMVAAVLRDGEIATVAAAGVRDTRTGQPLTGDEPFHIGSVTKSMTATAIASLVEDGTLRWDLTVGEALPAVEMLDGYRGITLRQLVDHAGGILPYTQISAVEEERFGSLPGVGGQQRAGFLKYVLAREPAAPPGKTMIYSNAGYSLAGHIAERVARTSWEKLLRERVFRPLGLETAGFGWPDREGHDDTARGHFGAPPEFRPREAGEYNLGDYLDPSGDVHMSVRDLARYARAHLRGLRGEEDLLAPATIQALHTAIPVDGQTYAGGWVLDSTEDGLPVHWHNGSTGIWFSMVRLVPQRNWGVVVMMNAGTPPDVIDTVCAELYSRG